VNHHTTEQREDPSGMMFDFHRWQVLSPTNLEHGELPWCLDAFASRGALKLDPLASDATRY